MVKIQILGGGCAKCAKLYEHAEAAAKELGIEYQMEKVGDFAKIAEFGISATPAMAVNGAIKIEGRVASAEFIKGLLKQA